MKKQDTIATMIPCLCSFTALHTLAAEPPVNKNVPEPFLIENRVRVRTVWWSIVHSSRTFMQAFHYRVPCASSQGTAERQHALILARELF